MAVVVGLRLLNTRFNHHVGVSVHCFTRYHKFSGLKHTVTNPSSAKPQAMGSTAPSPCMGYIYIPSLQHQLITPRSCQYVRAGGGGKTSRGRPFDSPPPRLPLSAIEANPRVFRSRLPLFDPRRGLAGELFLFFYIHSLCLVSEKPCQSRIIQPLLSFHRTL